MIYSINADDQKSSVVYDLNGLGPTKQRGKNLLRVKTSSEEDPRSILTQV